MSTQHNCCPQWQPNSENGSPESACDGNCDQKCHTGPTPTWRTERVQGRYAEFGEKLIEARTSIRRNTNQTPPTTAPPDCKKPDNADVQLLCFYKEQLGAATRHAVDHYSENDEGRSHPRATFLQGEAMVVAAYDAALLWGPAVFDRGGLVAARATRYKKVSDQIGEERTRYKEYLKSLADMESTLLPTAKALRESLKGWEEFIRRSNGPPARTQLCRELSQATEAGKDLTSEWITKVFDELDKRSSTADVQERKVTAAAKAMRNQQQALKELLDEARQDTELNPNAEERSQIAEVPLWPGGTVKQEDQVFESDYYEGNLARAFEASFVNRRAVPAHRDLYWRAAQLQTLHPEFDDYASAGELDMESFLKPWERLNAADKQLKERGGLKYLTGQLATHRTKDNQNRAWWCGPCHKLVESSLLSTAVVGAGGES